MPETTLNKVTEHVYWLSPGKPDRPSLCAIVGTRHTLLVDAGASTAHATLFLEALTQAGVPAPSYVVLTHWHWDHVFGSEALNIPILAQQGTAEQLAILAGYDWNDAALDHRVETSEEIAACAADIKQELPEPRSVRILLPDIVFEDSLVLHLGDVVCRIQHVGGDHAADACVVYVEPDRLLVLGDCLYDAIYTPTRHYTKEKLLPLAATILGFEAEHFIEGHGPAVLSRGELEAFVQKIADASSLADRFGTDETGALAALAELGGADEDREYLARGFIAGNRLQQKQP